MRDWWDSAEAQVCDWYVSGGDTADAREVDQEEREIARKKREKKRAAQEKAAAAAAAQVCDGWPFGSCNLGIVCSCGVCKECASLRVCCKAMATATQYVVQKDMSLKSSSRPGYDK